MSVSRRSFVAAALAAIAGGGSVAAAALAVKKEPTLIGVSPVAAPVDPDATARAKRAGEWIKASFPEAFQKERLNAYVLPRSTHSLLRDRGYNGHPDLVVSRQTSRRELESGSFDTERYIIDNLDWMLEKKTRGDGILYRSLPEVTREDGHFPGGGVMFRRYARAVGERKTVRRLILTHEGRECFADMTVEFDSTVGEGQITVIAKASNELICDSLFSIRQIIKRHVYLQSHEEARLRWGVCVTTCSGSETEKADLPYDLTEFKQSIRKVTLPPIPQWIPHHTIQTLRRYNHAC